LILPTRRNADVRPVLCGKTVWRFKERRFETAVLLWSAIANRRSLKSHDDHRCSSISGCDSCPPGQAHRTHQISFPTKGQKMITPMIAVATAVMSTAPAATFFASRTSG
jgi:hypothetical protein